MGNPDSTITIIEPQKGLTSLLRTKEIWLYRELLYFLTVRDVKVRYRQTVLGGLWAILQPFMTMVVFTIFFGSLAKIPSDSLPYPIFVYTALLPWQFFSNGITNAGNSIITSQQLITKVYFPRMIIPAASLGCGLLDFVVAFGLLILLMIYYGIYPGVGILLLPFLMIGVAAATLGIGLFLSALNVTYRDFRYVIPFLVQLWLFATPVIYPVTILPERWRWLMNLNPMAGLITSFRSSLLNMPVPWQDLMVSSLASLVLLVMGMLYYRRMESRFADII
jgi:lipopolysaccharide transport system permease protein